MLEYHCEKCGERFNQKCLCPECNVNVVRVITKHQLKRVRRRPVEIEEWTPDIQPFAYKRGVR
jgi:uncharacterized Zn finger protein (UPF0148 family)